MSQAIKKTITYVSGGEGDKIAHSILSRLLAGSDIHPYSSLPDRDRAGFIRTGGSIPQVVF